MQAQFAEITAIVVSLLCTLAVIAGVQAAVRGADNQTKLLSRIPVVIALGAGVMVTAVVLDFLPDAWEMAGEFTPWGIFIGILVLIIVTWLTDRGFEKEMRSTPHFTKTAAAVLAISLSFHTILEGGALGIAAEHLNLQNVEFMAALLIHKIPEGTVWGMAILTAFPELFSQNQKRIWFTLSGPAICVFIGTILGIYLFMKLNRFGIGVLASVLAGALLYISLAELVPALREYSSQRNLSAWFTAGILIMLLPELISHL